MGVMGRNRDYCRVCKGLGFEFLLIPKITCAACDGTGREPKTISEISLAPPAPKGEADAETSEDPKR